MKTKIYYKVVNSDLESARASRWSDDSWFIRYAIGVFVKPKNVGKLFVFDSLVAAEDFCSGDERIFKCEVKNPKRTKQVSNSIIFMRDFWAQAHQSNRKPAPKGTIFCDAVKLVKEVV